MADPQHPDMCPHGVSLSMPCERCNRWAWDIKRAGYSVTPDPQHPDIAAPTLAQMPALIAKHDEFAALAAEHGHEEMAALHAVTAAALRFLTRPVEDEEVRLLCKLMEIKAHSIFGQKDVSAALLRAASLLARLAREKASAERAARAAAIEEAARVADDVAQRNEDARKLALKAGRKENATRRESDKATALWVAAAIRALGEESAAPREEATS